MACKRAGQVRDSDVNPSKRQGLHRQQEEEEEDDAVSRSPAPTVMSSEGMELVDHPQTVPGEAGKPGGHCHSLSSSSSLRTNRPCFR